MQSEKRTAETAKGPQIAQIVRINAEGGMAEKRQRQGKPREPNDRNKPAACRGMKRRNPQSRWRPAGGGQALKLPLTAEHAENAEGDLGEKRQQQQRQAHAETRRTRREPWARNSNSNNGRLTRRRGERGGRIGRKTDNGNNGGLTQRRRDTKEGLGEKQQRQALKFELPSIAFDCR